MSKRSIRSVLKSIKHQSMLNVKEGKFLEKSSKDIQTIDYLLN